MNRRNLIKGGVGIGVALALPVSTLATNTLQLNSTTDAPRLDDASDGDVYLKWLAAGLEEHLTRSGEVVTGIGFTDQVGNVGQVESRVRVVHTEEGNVSHYHKDIFLGIDATYKLISWTQYDPGCTYETLASALLSDERHLISRFRNKNVRLLLV